MGDLSENFSRWEFKCKCNNCSCDTVDSFLLAVLEVIRDHFGKPVAVSSGHRCKQHNADEGGGEDSQHLDGRAADISIKDVSPHAIAREANALLHGMGGIGLYENFVHIDTRTNGPARWEG